MSDCIDPCRRNVLKFGAAALAMIPVTAFAAKNEPIRKAMKYKDTPEGDKKCSGCIHFVPGKTPTDLGGCKIFAGDTEVSPNGYCKVWVKKP